MSGESIEIKINDILVALARCDHCGKMPTEADAQKAIHAWKEDYAFEPCIGCGKTVMPNRMNIWHSSEAKWVASVPDRDVISIRYPQDRWGIGVPCHTKCLLAAFPNLDTDKLTVSGGVYRTLGQPRRILYKS